MSVPSKVRQDLVVHLQVAIEEIATLPRCRVIYLQGRGGLGKTYMLERLAEELQLAPDAESQVRFVRLIDMFSPKTRKTLELERLLRKGLSTSERSIPEAEVDVAFADYDRQLQEFQQIHQYARDEAQRFGARVALTQQFAACWNKLSSRYPLVIRLDTLELLIGRDDIPPDALVRRKEGRAGYDQVRDWMVALFRQLEYTLVLLCGRPPYTPRLDGDEQGSAEPSQAHALETPDAAPNRIEDNDLAVALARDDVLAAEDFRLLTPLHDHIDLQNYLRRSDVDVADDDLPGVRELTDGIPLLLTLYAECQRRDLSSAFVSLDGVTTRVDFEGRLVTTILNPVFYTRGPQQLAELPADERQRLRERETFTYCLYLLSYARRGITLDALAELLEAVEPELHLTMALRKQLLDYPLVKQADNWGDETQREKLLYLHDEIWLLIDESGLPDHLGLRDVVLTWLSGRSAGEVLRISEVRQHLQLVSAMADHVYYAVTRDFAAGYRHYLVYMDHLLGQREHEDALVLADIFWRMLTLVVVRPGGLTRIYRDLLSQDTRLTYEQVRWYDLQHYCQLLLALELNEPAADEAAALLDALAETEVFPSPRLIKAETPESWPAPIMLYANLILTQAAALTLVGKRPEQCQRLFQLLIALVADEGRFTAFLGASRARAEQAAPARRLQASRAWVKRFAASGDPTAEVARERGAAQPDEVAPFARDDVYARLRRGYLLGRANQFLGQLYRLQLRYDEAIDRNRAALSAYQHYHDHPLPADLPSATSAATVLNDWVLDEICQVQNNNAFTMAESGNLNAADRNSKSVVDEYAGRVRPYQRALILNTRATILLRLERDEPARILMEQALAAARESNVGRALGLVALTQARLARRSMNDAQALATEADDHYRYAARLFVNEQANLRDVYHERARYLRDMAYWYGQSGDRASQATYLAQALAEVNLALDQLPADPATQAVQWADLLETRVSIYNNQGRYELAWAELDQIEAAVMGYPMPIYGQVVAATLAFQRALLLLEDPARHQADDGHEREVLRLFTLTLARARAFAEQHRELSTLRRLVEDRIARHISPQSYADVVKRLNNDTLYVSVGDLPYQSQPSVLSASYWNAAWEYALKAIATMRPQPTPDLPASEAGQV